MTVGATPSGVAPDVSASNDYGAAQAGGLPGVPGGMTVGATPSGVPPGVSASYGSRAAVWCTTPCSCWLGCWSNTFHCSSRRLCQ
jgi:hypothetical protein